LAYFDDQTKRLIDWKPRTANISYEGRNIKGLVRGQDGEDAFIIGNQRVRVKDLKDQKAFEHYVKIAQDLN